VKIALKLISGYVVVCLIVAIVGYIGFQSNVVMEKNLTRVNDATIPVIEALEELRFAGLRIVSSTSEIVLLVGEKEAAGIEGGKGEGEKDLLRSGLDLYQKSLEKYAKHEGLINAEFPGEEIFVEEIEIVGKPLKKTSAELLELKGKGSSSTIRMRQPRC